LRGCDLVAALLLASAVVSLAAPTIVRMRDRASVDQCRNRMSQLALAATNYEAVNGALPPITRAPTPGPEGPTFFHLLPYIEKGSLYQTAGTSVRNKDVWSVVLPELTCPADFSHRGEERFNGWLATTSYAPNFQVLGDLPNGSFDARRKSNTISDGTAKTVLFAERYRVCGDTPNGWGYPDAGLWCPSFGGYSGGHFQHHPSVERCDPLRPQTGHINGMTVGFCDASVRTVSPRIGPEVWSALCTPTGGEVIDETERSENPVPVAKARAALTDRSATVRARAAEDLGRAGAKAKEAIPDLIPLLFERDPGVAETAAVALGELGADAVDPLVARLPLAHAGVPARIRVAVALGRTSRPAVRPNHSAGSCAALRLWGCALRGHWNGSDRRRRRPCRSSSRRSANRTRSRARLPFWRWGASVRTPGPRSRNW
jgi:hypothetical protein